ncbi:conserved hypothetical protein [Dickeya chrysanthemi Ech1591]|uniref:Uncharacterized protein n=1 Tax=Dickeya chrysanthemi (strain Ech1591) TaxID=561229 RepID=C6CK33_DICC1|nr:hypothetical protein [Dickeya chrysanthemi]ACT05549.1 conserved hypothetical protein [Dickeya chrysanthemi Ech1591]WJM84554.1 hypothetical protein QUF31_15645 [Dickeya chrysanthemi]
MTPWEQYPEWKEGDLFIDFSRANSAIKLDKTGKSGHGLTHYLKSVDFVVEWSNQLWLIEVKDPEHGAIPEVNREAEMARFADNMQSGALITKHLFPKLRDSLIYLGLDRGVANKQLKYIILIGLKALTQAELSALRLALWKTEWVGGPQPRGWGKSFDVLCMNVEQWNRLIDDCPVTRISQA